MISILYMWLTRTLYFYAYWWPAIAQQYFQLPGVATVQLISADRLESGRSQRYCPIYYIWLYIEQTATALTDPPATTPDVVAALTTSAAAAIIVVVATKLSKMAARAAEQKRSAASVVPQRQHQLHAARYAHHTRTISISIPCTGASIC